MALTNRISHNVFRTIAYTKKKWLRSNFLTGILMSLMSLMTYLSRYRCRYLLTALGLLLSSTFRLCQQQL
jgi:hypothetical protein